MLAASIAQDGKHVGKGHSLVGAIVSPGFMMLALIYFIIQIASYGLNFWAPHLIRAAGTTDPTLIGLLTSVPYIFGAVAMLIAGRLSDRKGARTTYVVVLLLMSAAGFVMAGIFATQPVLLIAALAIMGAGIVASIPSFWTLPPRLLVGAGAAGGIALINTLGQVGGIVSPVMIGWIRDTTGSTTPALYAIAGFCVLAAGLVGFCLPNGLAQKRLQSAAALVPADGD
jgi:MFS family permease